IIAFLASPPTITTETSAGRAEVAQQPQPTTATVQETLLAIVSEKTGYPAEMLEPVMRLDADLGIDSIKRVEILSALQERLPDAPVIKPEHLGTLQTLGDIVEFLTLPSGAPEVAPIVKSEDEERLPIQRLIPTRVSLDDRRPRELVPLRAGGEVWVRDQGNGD